MHDCESSDPPLLDDLVAERPEILVRGYRVVGVEETRDPTIYNLHMERMTWGDWQDAAARSERVWTFVRRKR